MSISMVLPRPTPPCKYTPRLCRCCSASLTDSAVNPDGFSPRRRSRNLCNADSALACWQSPPTICPACTRRSNSPCGPKAQPTATDLPLVSSEELGDASACASRHEDAIDAETAAPRPNDDARTRLQIMDEPLTTAPLLGSPSVPPDHVTETSRLPVFFRDGAI